MTVSRDVAELLDAFRAVDDRNVEQLGVLVIDDGFDALAVRVLSAFMHCDIGYEKPLTACPDNGRPTPRSWGWCWLGARLDYVQIAEAAGVSCHVAREKLAQLIGARLVYPDGTVSKGARAILQGAISKYAPRKRKVPDDRGAN